MRDTAWPIRSSKDSALEILGLPEGASPLLAEADIVYEINEGLAHIL